jgi:RNA polymerase sigma-70 factor (ECF subfamily)
VTQVKPARTEERELVRAVVCKDRKATAEFVSLYSDAVYSYVRHRLIPRIDLVDDLVQEVFLAAWGSLEAFRGESTLESWLLGIARHKVEDYYRSRLQQPVSFEDEPEENVTLDLALDEQLDRARLQEKTRKVLEGLPEIYSLALLWRYWERRSANEMAGQCGKSEKAIERILARARQAFKRRWTDV